MNVLNLIVAMDIAVEQVPVSFILAVTKLLGARILAMGVLTEYV